MKMEGTMEDNGILCGLIKLFGEGGIPNALVILGAEKSSISLFKIIPVLFDRTFAPNLYTKKQQKTDQCTGMV